MAFKNPNDGGTLSAPPRTSRSGKLRGKENQCVNRKKFDKTISENSNPSTDIHRRSKNPVTCSECNKNFRDTYSLKRHLRTHIEQQRLQCGESPEKLTRIVELKDHIPEKPLGSTKCLGTKQTLQRTSELYVGDNMCDVCGKVFLQRHRLKDHILIHTGEKPYKCTVCGHGFHLRSSLNRHTRIHTGELHECSVCSKKFNQRSNLVEHMLTHTGEKPHKCTTCGHAFHLKSSLVRHIQLHTGEKKFKCKVCGDKFLRQSSLEKHMVVHSGWKKFECSVCFKGFGDRYGLNRHMRSHTGEKPFKCSECGEAFARSSGLAAHVHTHSLDEKSLTCGECGEMFNGKRLLDSHMRSHKEDDKSFKCSWKMQEGHRRSAPSRQRHLPAQQQIKCSEDNSLKSKRVAVKKTLNKAKNFHQMKKKRVQSNTRLQKTTWRARDSAQANVQAGRVGHQVTLRRPQLSEHTEGKRLKFPSSYKFVIERKIPGDKKFECIACVERFSSVETLKSHFSTHLTRSLSRSL